ncbi:MAG: hypothetical protein C5B43_00255 [Verrucomicrobia bacterium]|nr:MAG: hypothetical protein C5B43_00255 [Verrucomicrobiota bacterium]
MPKKNSSHPPHIEHKTGFLPALIWTSAALFYLYEYIVRVAPNVMFSELESAFQVDSASLSASLASYYYIYAPMQLIVGILFDRFGGKRLLVPATLIVAIGCIIPTLSTNTLWTLPLGRLLMGFGSAFGFVGVLYVASVWYPPQRIAFLSGLTTALGMLGAIMGATLLSRLVDTVGWESSWEIAGISGLALALLLMIVIPKPPAWEQRRREMYKKEEKKFFLKGLITVLKNPQTWIIGFIGGALFLPLSLFADLWGIQYIMNVSKVTKTEAATAISLLYFGWLIGSPLAGWFSDFVGRRKAPLFWSALASGILFSLMLFFHTIPFWLLCSLLFISGLLCSSEVVTFVAGFEANQKYLKGTAMAVVNMIITIVGGLCQPLVGYLLVFLTKNRIAETGLSTLNTATDYRLAMIILPVILFLGAFVCFFMKETFIKDYSHN